MDFPYYVGGKIIMDISQNRKDFLSICLTFASRAESMDITLMTDMDKINTMGSELIIEDVMVFREALVDLMGHIEDCDPMFIKSCLSRITLPLFGVSYMCDTVDLADVAVTWLDKSKMKAVLNSILDKDLSTYSSDDRYYLYRTMSRMAVSTRDSVLIQRVLTALNS
jgi:hypothetical protein